MSDIVDRLWKKYRTAEGSDMDCEAANEIERLRAELVEAKLQVFALQSSRAAERALEKLEPGSTDSR